jgi:hypothetical protein
MTCEIIKRKCLQGCPTEADIDAAYGKYGLGMYYWTYKLQGPVNLDAGAFLKTEIRLATLLTSRAICVCAVGVGSHMHARW